MAQVFHPNRAGVRKRVEAIVRTDVNGDAVEWIVTVENDRIAWSVVDGAPTVTGGKMRVIELGGRKAAGERRRDSGGNDSANTTERYAVRQP